MNEAANPLWEARDHLLSHPEAWVQGTVGDDNAVRRCMIGHITGSYFEYGMLKARHKVTRVIKEQYPERVAASNPTEITFNFNDHEKTTVDDVILVLEKAAIRVDESV